MGNSVISLVSIGIAVIAVSVAILSLNMLQEQSFKIDALSDELAQLQSEKSKIQGRGTISQQSISKMNNLESSEISQNHVYDLNDLEKRLTGLEQNVDELKRTVLPISPDTEN